VSVNGIAVAELPARDGKTEARTVEGITPVLTPRWNVLRLSGTPGRKIGLLKVEWQPEEWRKLEFKGETLSLFNPGTGRDFAFRHHGMEAAALTLDGQAVARFEPGKKHAVLAIPAGNSRIGLSGGGFLEMNKVDDVEISTLSPEWLPPNNHPEHRLETLSNRELSIDFIHPGGTWDGERRFMAAGRTKSLRFRGREWAGWLPEYTRRGLADEFIEPAGYGGKNGEFIKFGVGVFRASADPLYSSETQYRPVTLFPWTTECSEGELRFRQRGEWRDYAYEYKKSYRLAPGNARLQVSHLFRNLGKARIITSYYCHNLFLPGGWSLSSELECRFGWTFTCRQVIGDLARAEPPYFRISPGGRQTAFFRLSGCGNASEARAEIRDANAGETLAISGDFLPWKVFFFCSLEAVSPEFHRRIEVAPGESATWNSIYEFSTDKQP
jgi:hypothetical protein